MKARFLALLMLLVLTACSAEAAPVMYIQPAELTEEEEALANLLGADTNQHLFDVVLDGTAKKMNVTAYELVDGEWKPWIGGQGGGTRLDENSTTGRLCFGFEDLRKDFRQAEQFGGKGYTAVSWQAPEEEVDFTLGRSIAFLSDRTEIVYEQEIPLAIQINTSRNKIISYNVEYFNEPEAFAEQKYEHVYALTVTFSQEPLS